MILAVGGWATLWMAVAADMGGSLLVVANEISGSTSIFRVVQNGDAN